MAALEIHTDSEKYTIASFKDKNGTLICEVWLDLIKTRPMLSQWVARLSKNRWFDEKLKNQLTDYVEKQLNGL